MSDSPNYLVSSRSSEAEGVQCRHEARITSQAGCEDSCRATCDSKRLSHGLLTRICCHRRLGSFHLLFLDWRRLWGRRSHDILPILATDDRLPDDVTSFVCQRSIDVGQEGLSASLRSDMAHHVKHISSIHGGCLRAHPTREVGVPNDRDAIFSHVFFARLAQGAIATASCSKIN